MSASMQIWHSCCHFVYQQIQTCTCSERRLIDSRLGLFVSSGTGSDESLRRRGGVGGWGVRVLFPRLSCCKCTSRSVSPRSLRTKKGLMGVHATKLPSKDAGQGDGRLFAAEKNKRKKDPFPILPPTSLCFALAKSAAHSASLRIHIWKNCDNSLMTQPSELPWAIQISSAACQSHSYSPKPDPLHMKDARECFMFPNNRVTCRQSGETPSLPLRGLFEKDPCGL